MTVESTCVTDSSLLAFGSRDGQSVVLKVLRNEGDEWRSGAILEAFDGRGMSRVYEHVGGGVLMERLQPGQSLADMALGGRDNEATAILADVIAKLCPHASANAWPAVEDWAAGFDRYEKTPKDERSEKDPNRRNVEQTHAAVLKLQSAWPKL